MCIEARSLTENAQSLVKKSTSNKEREQHRSRKYFVSPPETFETKNCPSRAMQRSHHKTDITPSLYLKITNYSLFWSNLTLVVRV